jgi:guanylate kinase
MRSEDVGNAGRLIILSGPSGAGKSTVIRRLLSDCPLPLALSVSATTRQPRAGEVDGKDYHFVNHQQFFQMKEAGDFLECREVFGRGDWYGTIAREVDQGLSSGKWIILEIDVQGALAVMQFRPGSLSFFIHPESLDELAIRLRRRGTDSEEAIRRRLEVAREELQALKYYQYEIINREVEQSVAEICQLLHQHVPGAKHA